MELSYKERLFLFNQYLILEALYPDREQDYRRAQRAVLDGYEPFYDEPVMMSRNPVSGETCQEVGDIMTMYTVLQHSYEEAGEPEGVNEDALPFPGFDGNSESQQHGYASFLLNTMDRFGHLEIGESGLNSHFPMLDQYRRMLREWKQRREGVGPRKLSEEDIVAILNA